MLTFGIPQNERNKLGQAVGHPNEGGAGLLALCGGVEGTVGKEFAVFWLAVNVIFSL